MSAVKSNSSWAVAGASQKRRGGRRSEVPARVVRTAHSASRSRSRGIQSARVINVGNRYGKGLFSLSCPEGLLRQPLHRAGDYYAEVAASVVLRRVDSRALHAYLRRGKYGAESREESVKPHVGRLGWGALREGLTCLQRSLVEKELDPSWIERRNQRILKVLEESPPSWAERAPSGLRASFILHCHEIFGSRRGEYPELLKKVQCFSTAELSEILEAGGVESVVPAREMTQIAGVRVAEPLSMRALIIASALEFKWSSGSAEERLKAWCAPGKRFDLSKYSTEIAWCRRHLPSSSHASSSSAAASSSSSSGALLDLSDESAFPELPKPAPAVAPTEAVAAKGRMRRVVTWGSSRLSYHGIVVATVTVEFPEVPLAFRFDCAKGILDDWKGWDELTSKELYYHAGDLAAWQILQTADYSTLNELKKPYFDLSADDFSEFPPHRFHSGVIELRNGKMLGYCGERE